MTRVWKKVPRVTRTCACGCGVDVTGTARRMYAKPYCKFKSYLERKKREGWAPQGKFNPYKPKENPLNNVIPFKLGE